jgi:KUP system potassium uptake protein
MQPGHVPVHTSGDSKRLWKLTLGAVGVVYGDIGTSPLYTFRESLAGHHPLPIDQLHVFGVMSLIFWALILVVTIKYVTFLTRADNNGEGGSLALLALIMRRLNIRQSHGIVLLGVFACALFYGDAMITPAISVLSAVEGLTVVEASLQPLVIPIAVGILVGLFMLQRIGTGRVGALFGPVILIYFATIALLGSLSVVQNPTILLALNPSYGVQFFLASPWSGFLALGSVFLAVTGSEALYADMGHFGRRPIQFGWLCFALPALLLNYLGQAALLVGDASAIQSPFYLLAPEWFRLPLVFIATMATIIASQAVITGAFSVTQQAVQLGFIPRMRILHTSAHSLGQIYIPSINWALMTMVVVLVLMFQNSSNLAAAYGVAVTGAMLIESIQLAIVFLFLWKFRWWISIPLLLAFFTVDISFFSAALMKVPDGGWFPLVVGFTVFALLTTWAKGRRLMRDRMVEAALPLDVFAKSAHGSAARVPGTAIFMASTNQGVPSALLHNIKHNKVIHERVVVLTVDVQDVPYVEADERYEVEELGEGFYRLTLHYGFMEETDIPAALARRDLCGGPFDMMKTSFFLSRQTLLPSEKPGMAIWREKLFSWMSRNAASAMEFFRLPTNRVVELGSQLEI